MLLIIFCMIFAIITPYLIYIGYVMLVLAGGAGLFVTSVMSVCYFLLFLLIRNIYSKISDDKLMFKVQYKKLFNFLVFCSFVFGVILLIRIF